MNSPARYIYVGFTTDIGETLASKECLASHYGHGGLTVRPATTKGDIVHLRAEMPPAKIASRGLMELRIARKVAALSGIPGPADSSDDAGRGRSWVSDYQFLTLTELTLGAPLKAPARAGAADGGVFTRRGRRFRYQDEDRDQDIDYAPIPNATLGEYGPDTKAALVLTGVNKVLEPLTAAVTEALADIRIQVDAPILLVAVGQCLLQEVFAAQPVLLLHGIQASQIQRALMLSDRIVSRSPAKDTPLARVEHGVDRPPPIHAPVNLEIVYHLWDSVVAGAELDPRGNPRGGERFLRAKPLFGFEQNDLIAFAGGSELRARLVSVLRDASESSLTGSVPGAPRPRVMVVDAPGEPPAFEVSVPRQRQIELMLADVAPRLVPRLLDEPLVRGQPLALPTFNVAKWRGRPRLHKAAALLAHYYSLRAAGWISGMTKFDHRRNRDECAQRCEVLMDAAIALLRPEDPLRDQIIAFALGYRQQYEATYGRPAEFYPTLAGTLDRMVRRVHDGATGRAVAVEILPLVLENLRSSRRAVTFGLVPAGDEQRLTTDLDRWWQATHELRAELIRDPTERNFVNLSYVSLLLDYGRDDADILQGLELVVNNIANRKQTAKQDGRWIAVRAADIVYLRGLSIALDGRIDEGKLATWATAACGVAAELAGHQETRKFLTQRTGTDRGRDPSYDGSALILLIALAEGWMAAVRSGALDKVRAEDAYKRADEAVRDLKGYLETVQTDETAHSLHTSQLDPLRRVIAQQVITRWEGWVAEQ